MKISKQWWKKHNELRKTNKNLTQLWVTAKEARTKATNNEQISIKNINLYFKRAMTNLHNYGSQQKKRHWLRHSAMRKAFRNWKQGNLSERNFERNLFYRYYFGRCSSELAQLVPLPYSWERSTHYSDRLHDFSATIPRCYKDVYVNGFFPCTNRCWNSLSIEYFPLTYDRSDFKSRINRHLWTVISKQISCML